MANYSKVTPEQRKLFIDRIDALAKKENITAAEAAKRLKLPMWRYYEYKRVLPAVDVQDEDLGELTVNLVVTGAPKAVLMRLAGDYGVSPDAIAAILLHARLRKIDGGGLLDS